VLKNIAGREIGFITEEFYNGDPEYIYDEYIQS